MSPFKFFVGQKVRIIKRAGTYATRLGYAHLYGTIQTVGKRRVDKSTGTKSYRLLGIPLDFAEHSLAPVDDNKPQLGNWEEITKILGIDIRKERETKNAINL